MGRPRRETVLLVLTLSMLFPIMKSQTFDSFYFVQQWPQGVCGVRTGQCVGQGLRYFTIHGVWPQKGGSSVINCPGTQFDFNQISSLSNTLNVVWPNVITGNNVFFWGYEWNKHGTCSESKFKMLLYFQMAINMKNSIDLLNAMRVGGVIPNKNLKSKQRVEVVVFNKFKAYPLLRCQDDSNSQSLLTEVVMCFKDDGVTLLNCTRSRSNCPGSFIF